MAMALGSVGRLCLWAVLAAVASQLIFAACVPRKRVAYLKHMEADARQSLRHFDGPFAHAMPLLGKQVRTAFLRLGYVLPPTLIAIMPLLGLLAWIESAYGYQWPEHDTAPKIEVVPDDYRAEWRRDGQRKKNSRAIVVTAPGDEQITTVQLERPASYIHKHQWWNYLLPNPAGYLPQDGRLTALRIGVPAKTYVHFGPQWLQSWLTVFIPGFALVSLALHRLLGLV